MESLCGAKCEECEYYNNRCEGCSNTKGCPIGKKCWIAKYIEVGGNESFIELKKILIDEINSLNIDGFNKIDELYPLHGSYVNLEYMLPNGNKVKYLKDDEIYLGNQVECAFNTDEIKKCFGIVANMSFIIICEYEEDGTNPELLIYKKR